MSSKVTRRTVIQTGMAATAALPLARSAWAQAWPSKPIKIVVGYPAGGLTDLFARAYGDYLSQKLGQPVVVENKPGAGGTIAAQAVKAAPPDGYTLMFTISTTMFDEPRALQEPALRCRQGLRAHLQHAAGQLAVRRRKATGATNLKEFAEYARKNKVNVGTYAAGSYAHIAIAELNKHFGLQMEAVHYRGEAPMWQDLAAGVIQAATAQLCRRLQRAAVWCGQGRSPCRRPSA